MLKKLTSLDFRSKTLIVILIPLVLVIGNLHTKNLLIATIVSIFPCFLMLCYGKIKESIIYIVLIFIGMISHKYLIKQNLGMFNAMVIFLIQMMLKMLPGFIMAKFSIQTTDMSEIISSLKKLHFTDILIIPITVMARFFYTIKKDYQQIRVAMYMDGLTFSKLMFHPIKLYEFRLIPLLMILMRSADEVAKSAVCRGLQIGKKRSYLVNHKLKIFDYICILFMLFVTIITWSIPYA